MNHTRISGRCRLLVYFEMMILKICPVFRLMHNMELRTQAGEQKPGSGERVQHVSIRRSPRIASIRRAHSYLRVPFRKNRCDEHCPFFFTTEPMSKYIQYPNHQPAWAKLSSEVPVCLHFGWALLAPTTQDAEKVFSVCMCVCVCLCMCVCVCVQYL